MKIIRHSYSEALHDAAEQFLINQFDAPTQFSEAGHLPDLVDAAMHIVTAVAWVQPDGARPTSSEVPYGETGGEDDEDEDED